MTYTCKIKSMLLFSSFKKSEILKIAFSLETKLNLAGEENTFISKDLKAPLVEVQNKVKNAYLFLNTVYFL